MLIECIPNISEGRRTDILDACAEAIRATGARLLDVKPDATHNRTVYSFAGDRARCAPRALALFDAAARAIDLRTHSGEHPRIGAVDVVPFVPDRRRDDGRLRRARPRRRRRRRATASSCRCSSTRKRPRRPARRNLEDIRRGEFEGLGEKLKQPEWHARLRSRDPARVRRRVGRRRAHPAHRLQHQPGHQSSGRREEDRHGRSARARAASASSRRWASRSRIAASSRSR